MKVLILGGTKFVGKHLVSALEERDHEITLFNRGVTNPHIFPHIERIHGDRSINQGIHALENVLKNCRFDAIIDTSGYNPLIVQKSTSLCEGKVNQYIFVSTIAVYANFSTRFIDENAEIIQLDPDTFEYDPPEKLYGGYKAMCELLVERSFPKSSLIIRPGLIVGPDDPTDRFTYWPHRFAKGGDILLPKIATDAIVQFIDVRDLARFIVIAMEKKLTGAYNVTSEPNKLTSGAVWNACMKVTDEDCNLVPVDLDFLLQEGLQEWMELPLWIARSSNMPGYMSIDVQKAITAGLVIRPLSETIKDILIWCKDRPAEYEWKPGLSPVKEQEILAKWRDKLIIS